MSPVNYSSARCDCGCGIGSKRPALRPNPRHKRLDRVLNLVRVTICDPFERQTSGAFREDSTSVSFTAERLASFLDADLATVKLALHRLNIEGLVTQPSKSIPHDSNRDPQLWGNGFSGWTANVYHLTERAKNALHQG